MELILLIALRIFLLFLAGRATIGIAALLGDIPPKNRLYWIKPLLIHWLFVSVAVFVLGLVSAKVADLNLLVLGNIILFSLSMWLLYQGSKNEVKEKMKAAGFSYNKTNWGLVGCHLFFLLFSHSLVLLAS